MVIYIPDVSSSINLSGYGGLALTGLGKCVTGELGRKRKREYKLLDWESGFMVIRGGRGWWWLLLYGVYCLY